MARGSLFAIAALLTGCVTSVGSEGPGDRAAAGGIDDPTVAIEPPAADREPAVALPSWTVDVAARATKPLVQFSCRKDAFCDDFEGATPGSKWTSSVAANGSLSFVGPSSSLGAKALRATAAANGAPSFLEIAGKTLNGSWAGALGVSVRVEQLPQTSVGGPEMVVRDENGDAIARIAIVITRAGIGLEQRGPGCEASSCAARLDMLVPVVAGEWNRVVIGVEAQDAEAAPYGRIEVSVDGSDNAFVPLVVRPIGAWISASAGLTRVDSAPAALRVDDVMFFTR